MVVEVMRPVCRDTSKPSWDTSSAPVVPAAYGARATTALPIRVVIRALISASVVASPSLICFDSSSISLRGGRASLRISKDANRQASRVSLVKSGRSLKAA